MVLCNSAAVLAALALHRLSLDVLQDSSLAARATLMFCLTPASIFYSAIYTESLFAVLSFVGMLCARRSPWLATAAFAAATATRSNGILSCSYLVYAMLCNMAAERGSTLAMPAPADWQVRQAAVGRRAAACAPVLFATALHARLPYLYGHVQAAYWDVGLLRSYRPNQAPNILLAAPILAMSACGADAAAPYVLHWAAATAAAALVLHVQVSTRFLSSCPPLYWYAARLAGSSGAGARRAVWGFFLGYALLGALLFPNFYPWN
ncbi:hypothetical protein WJX81_007104 [Elliptochloris bilobata]|uniref:GPI mannosyltransferase 2 n=1 Tax=Elliptochloris bilobata TaxID=381761 RepID=A0AAW1R2M5_9CHLO